MILGGVRDAMDFVVLGLAVLSALALSAAFVVVFVAGMHVVHGGKQRTVARRAVQGVRFVGRCRTQGVKGQQGIAFVADAIFICTRTCSIFLTNAMAARHTTVVVGGL